MVSPKTIVVKIGSSLLVDEATSKLRMNFLHFLMNDVAHYKSQGHNVVLVSSGSVALGKRFTSQKEGSSGPTLAQKQAAAAQGQPLLMAVYHQFAREHDLRIAQILITLHDFEDRRRFLNAEDTLEELLAEGAIPIVNENDTVATQHLRVGDNDRLSAKVAQLVEADELVILTNVAGLLDANGKVVEEIEELNENIFGLAGGASGVGTGGMITKLQAAEIASASGCITHIGSGHGETPLQDALENKVLHTTIKSGTTPENARNLWISTSLEIHGQMEVSKEAVTSLKQGEGLYPSDIKEITEGFNRGDIVSLFNEGEEIARGIVSFYDYEVRALMGKERPDIFAILGYSRRPDIIHKNDLAVLSNRFYAA